MRNLLRRLFTQHRMLLIVSCVILGGFQFLLCAMVSSIDVQGALDQITMFAPPVMRTMIEQSLLGGSSAGILAFGWNHPITHALLTGVTITFAARAVAGEVENGAIELVLSQPLSRLRYLTAHVSFGILAIAIVAAAGLSGSLIGQAVFGLHVFTPGPALKLALNLLLLQAALYFLTLFVSTWSREAGRAALVGVLGAVLSYLVNTIATLWDKAAFTKPYSLHTYYDPRSILVHAELRPLHILVLATFSVLLAASAWLRFRTRDLP